MGTKDPEKILQEFSNDFQEAFGSGLVSLILYGSGAGADFDPKKSDLNFLAVLTEAGINQLSKTFTLLKKWEKRGVAIPICVTRAYIESSLDTFPLEFLNMKNSYRLTFGEDVLKDLSFDKKDVRLQVERELKGKLLHLRGAYLETKGNLRSVKPVIATSLTTFASIFRGILFLLEKDMPQAKRDVISSAGKEMGLDNELFNKLYDIAKGLEKPSSSELDRIVIRYIEEIKKAAFFIDKLDI